MKLCPYCSSQIEDDDAKCRFCGEWVIRRRKRTAPKKKKGLGCGAVVVLVVILVAVWGGRRLRSSPETVTRILGGPTAMEVLRSELERLLALEEEYAREHGAYTGNTFSLGFSPPEDVTVSLTATPTGWAATGTHQALSPAEGCAVYVGTAKPPTSPVSPEVPEAVVCTG